MSYTGRAHPLDRTQALEQFLAGIEKRALRMAQIATGDLDEALDLVQEAMLKLVQRYASRGTHEWGPLFHRILQSKIRDWYRRKRIRDRWRLWFGGREDEDAPDPLETVPDTATLDLTDQLSHKRAAARLDEALRSLPLRQQQAFLLRIWEEYDVHHTAKVMRCSEGSVKTHLSRAIHALRERLGDQWP